MLQKCNIYTYFYYVILKHLSYISENVFICIGL